MFEVTLSRRNLLSLLHKLEMRGSACTIIKSGGIVVHCQSDEECYAGREPGPMHPDTEEFVREMGAALKIIRDTKGLSGEGV